MDTIILVGLDSNNIPIQDTYGEAVLLYGLDSNNIAVPFVDSGVRATVILEHVLLHGLNSNGVAVPVRL